MMSLGQLIAVTLLHLAFMGISITAQAEVPQSTTSVGSTNQHLGSWRVQEYQGVRWTRQGDTVELAGDGMPAGLSFQSAAEPDRKYRLVIKGQAISGAAVLRVQLDNNTPQW